LHYKKYKLAIKPLIDKKSSMNNLAAVVKLVDTPDLGSGGESRGGSSPSSRTNYNKKIIFGRFSFLILYLLKIIN
tara:strand:- start:105 stop:329 length:225 start_codon:yes stop_codon:yes gene_type:complete